MVICSSKTLKSKRMSSTGNYGRRCTVMTLSKHIPIDMLHYLNLTEVERSHVVLTRVSGFRLEHLPILRAINSVRYTTMRFDVDRLRPNSLPERLHSGFIKEFVHELIHTCFPSIMKKIIFPKRDICNLDNLLPTRLEIKYFHKVFS